MQGEKKTKQAHTDTHNEESEMKTKEIKRGKQIGVFLEPLQCKNVHSKIKLKLSLQTLPN